MTIRWGARSWQVDVQQLMEKAQAGASSTGEPLRVTIAPDVEMIVSELYGDKGETNILRGATFWLVVKE